MDAAADRRPRPHQRMLTSGTVEAGEHTAPWDGRNAAGAEVPAGLYYVRFEVEGQAFRVPILLVR